VTISAQTALGDVLSAATEALAAAGVESPRLDAELMLSDASGLDRTRFATDPELAVEAPAGRIFAAMVRRRLRREPVAYILGSKGFRHLSLACDRRALIPRPETELLVEIAAELAPHSVVDVGTGSGAVALAIADELADVTVYATDTSEEALGLARENAARLGLADRIHFEHGTLPSNRLAAADPRLKHPATGWTDIEARRQGAEPQFDLVVANLPYVPEEDWAGLAPEITEYEPREALLGGPDGLGPIRSLLEELVPLRNRAIALEIGIGQATEVEQLVGSAGFEAVERRTDLAGIERVVLGRR
jgi:release factor glutamine methyltransferase